MGPGSRPGRRRWSVACQASAQTQFRTLAARCARVVDESFAQRKQRAWGMPGARCTRSPCALVGSTRSSPRSRRDHPAFPHANGFTAYVVLSPATNSSCHRRWRIGGFSVPGRARKTSANLTPATGARTTRFCRPRSVFANRLRRAVHVRRSFGEGGSNAVRLHALDRSRAFRQPALQPRPRARRCRVHRIPSQRP
jgi:hypothetical protein